MSSFSGIRKLVCCFGLLLVCSSAIADGPKDPPLTVEEEDGSPSGIPTFKIQVPNGTLTRDSSTTVSLDYMTQTAGDLRYLKLDASNDPLTGDLTTTGQVIIDSDSNGLTLGDDQDISLYSNGAGILWIYPNAVDTDTTLNFWGTTNRGQLKWMEDEDYFSFTDQVLLNDKLIFTQTDGNEYIDSLADGYLDLGATTSIRTGAQLDHGAYASSWMTRTAPVTDATKGFVYAKDYVAPVAGEGIDAYTKLMLHCDGVDASTTFTDSSLSPKTMTAVNNAQIDTAQSEFGGASGLFDGTNDLVTTPDHADFDFSNGNFTVDLWARWNSLPASGNYQSFCGQWATGADDGWWFGMGNTGGTYHLDFAYTTDGDTTLITSVNLAGLSTGTWYHIAAIRNGSDLKLFLNGTQQGSTYNISTATIWNSSQLFTVGCDAGNAYDFNGWMDEIRISKGIARWTSNFTPPTEAYGAGTSEVPANLYAKNGDGVEFKIGDTRSSETSVTDNTVVRFDSTTGKIIQDSTVTIDDNGDLHLVADNDKVFWGAADDASAYYDGTNLVVNPKAVGSGYLSVLGDIVSNATLSGTTAKLSSLTDGYVPYHVADATGLANSPLFVSGTNVGINQTSPTYALDVQATAGTSAAENVLRIKVSDNAGYLQLTNATGTDARFSPTFMSVTNNEQDSLQFIALTSADTGTKACMIFDARTSGAVVATRPVIAFKNYTTDIMNMLANGNVGIGTTSPAQKLHVAGVGLITDKLAFTQTDLNEYIDSLADGYLDLGATTAVRSQGLFQTLNGVIGKITTVTDTYTVLATDETVICNKATNFTVTLPTAVVGQKFTIKNIGAGVVTVDGASTDTIDGDLTQSLITWETFTVQCYAANKWGVL